MIFRRELADQVMAGDKTVTRRFPTDNPRSPWYRHGGPVVGKDYAVVPGRGKHQVGRVVVDRAEICRLGELTAFEAGAEGFDSVADFRATWLELHGTYNPDEQVWVVEFHVMEANA